jgi:hypothetical protein
VNDIQTVLQYGHAILFADDTNIMFSHTDLTSLCTLANSELDNLTNWFLVNKLSVNISKTKYVLFHTNRKNSIPSNLPPVEISGQALERVQTIKFLGVILHENLSWKSHLDHQANKIAKATGIINRLKHQLPSDTLLTLYNSLILPYLQYAIIAWGNSPQQHIKRVEILQKKAVHFITGSRYKVTTHLN